jgi:hypothetical protein
MTEHAQIQTIGDEQANRPILAEPRHAFHEITEKHRATATGHRDEGTRPV